MSNVALTLLSSSCPITSDLAGADRCTPSRWLTAGYVPRRFEDGSTGWQKLASHQVAKIEGHQASAEEVATFYRRPATRWLLARLSVTFAQFFPLSAKEWEEDLRCTTHPITCLSLWETVADVFDYYTKGKHFSAWGRQEYFDTLWLFFHHGSAAAGFDGRPLRSLSPGRVKRVAAELEHYFLRRKPCPKPELGSADA